MSRADELIEALVDGKHGEELAAFANELQQEFHRGYPVGHLKDLLTSHHVDVVKAGAWIASELGIKARPLLQEIAKLLHHDSPYIRFFAIDSVLSCATENDGRTIAEVVALLLEDPEGSVRWKAADFLTRCSDGQISAAVAQLESEGGHAELASELRRLLSHRTPTSSAIAQILRRGSRTEATLAMVMAARREVLDDELLALAQTLDDPDLGEIARSEIRKRARRARRRPSRGAPPFLSCASPLKTRNSTSGPCRERPTSL